MLRSQFQNLTLSLTGIAVATLFATAGSGTWLAQDADTSEIEKLVGQGDKDLAKEGPKRVPVTGWEIEPKWEPLIGTWALMSFQHPTETILADSIRGFLTVGEGFLSMIIHARPTEGENDTDFPDRLAQSGLHRWRISEQGILQLANVMGHSNFGYELEWELPNEPREFSIVLEENSLVLTRPDFGELDFRRITKADFPEAALERIRELTSESE
ncbi:MAG: hypothetical protein P8N31_02005 [Planctomycetota bacterium]|jgi:hypothetical protein|nr:hypothetical protein [Planctomycetota bacterium]MDG2142307.1 hypothetical protein [Planctomycetota bacterium]